MQSALGNSEAVKGKFKGSTEISDCYFYQSGISSIGVDAMFNSTFLEMALPSEIVTLLKDKGLIPYVPTHVSGSSYPVKVNISGDTRFYDYKIADNIELDGLLKENFSTLADNFGEFLDGKDITINIDTIFPLKDMLISRASGALNTNAENGKRYVNIPITFYGGGLNVSEVTSHGYANADSLGGKVSVNLLESCLAHQQSGTSATLKALALKMVITGSGYEPFAFRFVENGYLYGETPKVTDLIAKNKGD
jgi:hypothetical protein